MTHRDCCTILKPIYRPAFFDKAVVGGLANMENIEVGIRLYLPWHHSFPACKLTMPADAAYYRVLNHHPRRVLLVLPSQLREGVGTLARAPRPRRVLLVLPSQLRQATQSDGVVLWEKDDQELRNDLARVNRNLPWYARKPYLYY